MPCRNRLNYPWYSICTLRHSAVTGWSFITCGAGEEGAGVGGVILKILTVFFGEGGHFHIRERYRGLGYFNRFHETNTSTKERELKMNVTVNNNGKHRLLIINVVNFGPIFSKNIALQFPQQSGGSQFHFMYIYGGGGGISKMLQWMGGGW